MEIKLKIEGGKTSESMLLVTLSINGESGRGRTRMRWIDCGELIGRLGFYIACRRLPPDDCAELLTSLSLYSKRIEPRLKQEFARLHKRFLNAARKTGPKALTPKEISRRLDEALEKYKSGESYARKD